MRRNVQGTVTLYAVIRSDGSVGEVRVLQGVDDRLDAYAKAFGEERLEAFKAEARAFARALAQFTPSD